MSSTAVCMVALSGTREIHVNYRVDLSKIHHKFEFHHGRSLGILGSFTSFKSTALWSGWVYVMFFPYRGINSIRGRKYTFQYCLQSPYNRLDSNNVLGNFVILCGERPSDSITLITIEQRYCESLRPQRLFRGLYGSMIRIWTAKVPFSDMAAASIISLGILYREQKFKNAKIHTLYLHLVFLRWSWSGNVRSRSRIAAHLLMWVFP